MRGLLLYTEFWSLDSAISALDSYLPAVTYGAPLANWILPLCSIAIFYHASSIVIQNVIRGGEGFSFDMVRKPFFYILLLYAWPLLTEFIGFVVEAANVYVDDSQLAVTNAAMNSSSSFQSILDMVKTNLGAVMAAEMTNEFDTIVAIQFIDDFLIYGALNQTFSLISFMDTGLLVCFHIVSKIWLFLTYVGAPIALIVSLFTGSFAPLINWLKSLLSVSLWVAVGGFVINLLNKILIELLGDLIDNFNLNYNTLNNATGNESLLLDPLFKEKLFLTIVYAIALFIVFLVLKIILLGKTPQIISSWVGGGSATGGGLSAAFLAVSATKNVAGGAVSAGTAAATGGASVAAGALGSKLKK